MTRIGTFETLRRIGNEPWWRIYGFERKPVYVIAAPVWGVDRDTVAYDLSLKFDDECDARGSDNSPKIFEGDQESWRKQ